MKRISLLFIFIFLFSVVWAGEDKGFTGGKMIYLQTNGFGASVHEDGNENSFDTYGKDFSGLLSSNEKASNYLKSYKGKYTCGMVSLGLSIVLLCASVAPLPMRGDTPSIVQLQATMYALAFGLAADIGALVFLVSAENDLHLAVFEYNKSICPSQSFTGREIYLVKGFEF